MESCHSVCNLLGMNRSELQTILQAERINPDAYDLSGVGRDETYVLREEPFGWSVFYSERGLQRNPQTFGTESEACDCLLTALRNDLTAS